MPGRQIPVQLRLTRETKKRINTAYVGKPEHCTSRESPETPICAHSSALPTEKPYRPPPAHSATGVRDPDAAVRCL